MIQNDKAACLKKKREQFIAHAETVNAKVHKVEEHIKLMQGGSSQSGSVDSLQQIKNIEAMKQLDDLKTVFFSYIKTKNLNELGTAAESLRRVMSINNNPPVDELISTGLVPHIMKLLDHKYFMYERILNECAWIIANIASRKKEHAQYVIKLGAAGRALNLLDHDSGEVKDNAIWILANIAGNSFEDRDMLINMGIVPKIVIMLDGNAYEPSVLGHTAWLMSNLCRGKPYPSFEKVEPLLPIVQFFLHGVDDKEVMTHTMWCLSYLSHGSHYQIKSLLDLDVTSHIIAAVNHKESGIRAPAFRAVGNILTENNALTKIMIDHEVIPVLAGVLDDSKSFFRREACWAISNILADSVDHIERIITYNNQSIIKKIFQMIRDDKKEIVEECFHCLINICCGGTYTQMHILVEKNLMEIIVNHLKTENRSKMANALLEALNDLLTASKKHDESDNHLLIRFKQCLGFVTVNNLKTHPDLSVSNAASNFIEKWSSVEN